MSHNGSKVWGPRKHESLGKAPPLPLPKAGSVENCQECDVQWVEFYVGWSFMSTV